MERKGLGTLVSMTCSTIKNSIAQSNCSAISCDIVEYNYSRTSHSGHLCKADTHYNIDTSVGPKRIYRSFNTKKTSEIRTLAIL